MFKYGTPTRRIVAAIALSLTSLAVVVPSAQAAPGYYPSGQQVDVPISTIIGGGWKLCYSDQYRDSANITDVIAGCQGKYVLLAGGATGADSYLLAAAGERSAVFGSTAYDATTYNNGSYWYFNPGMSMGFAPNSTIDQNEADIRDSSLDGHSDGSTTGAYRLSWHMYSGDLDPGWRIGLIDDLNSSSNYVRAIYVSDGAPPIPQLVVGAVNVLVDAGSPVPADFRVLGLRGADSVSDVVLEYEGTNIWGDHFGPSLTPPSAAGSYVISVKSYKLTSSDPAYYTGQFKHSAVLSIRWVPTLITDAALAGLPTGNAVPVKYAASGASVTGDTWSVAVNGAPVSVAGGKLLTDPGAVLAVSGKGFRPFSAVRVFVTPTEVGSVWTDAAGSFAKSVTVPGTAAGAQNLQVNGYSPAGVVRSVNVALQVGTTRRLTGSVRFDVGSTALKASIETRLQSMLSEVPVAPWVIHVSVATSAAGPDAKSQAIAQARVNVVIIRLRAALEAAGATVEVDSVIWDQPGLTTSRPLQLRIVDVELTW
jgi:hypothetical protein